jgi:hypothetical protein
MMIRFSTNQKVHLILVSWRFFFLSNAYNECATFILKAILHNYKMISVVFL